MYLPSEKLAETKEDPNAVTASHLASVAGHRHASWGPAEVPRWWKGTLNPGLRDLVPKGTGADIPPDSSLLVILNNSQF